MSVSRETYIKIEFFVQMLCKWNKRINLIAKETESLVWERHIENSLELLEYLPLEKRVVFDLGAGAGLPGLVVAIARPKLECILIESDARKCAFLREAASQLSLGNVKVQNERIENISLQKERPIFISRALASIEIIFELLPSYLLDLAEFRLLKGANANVEIAEARKKWNFNVASYAASDNVGYVLAIDNVSLKK